jgi:Plasmid pRiA4b ORF-3-like protein
VAKVIQLYKDRYLQLRIELLGLPFGVWRRVVVPESITLSNLHRVLQVAMGWLDMHLHEFDINGVRYGLPVPEWDTGPNAPTSEKGVRLNQCLGDAASFHYLYDFGDDWQHRIHIEKVLQPDSGLETPICLDGAGACPPEDVGGVPGYHALLAALGDPNGPDRFDLEKTNRALFKVGL